MAKKTLKPEQKKTLKPEQAIAEYNQSVVDAIEKLRALTSVSKIGYGFKKSIYHLPSLGFDIVFYTAVSGTTGWVNDNQSPQTI